MEEIKTKILKILPYWLIVLILAVSAFAAAALFNKKNAEAQPQQSLSGQPQVLGVSTSNTIFRGDQPAVGQIKELSEPDTSKIQAKSFLAFDLATGQNLIAENIDQKLSIASLTKLMTALVTYENADLNGSLTVVGEDVLNIRPVLGLSAGDKVKILDVFNSMLIGSCNDAALTLANYINGLTGKNFIDLMNEQAKAMGMNNTSYDNPIGFDSQNNYSTADDLKILITKVQSLSVFKDLGRRTSYRFLGKNNRIFYTTATNKLLKSHPDIQAIKTGYTDEAKGAMATKVTIGGHEIVILVLDSQNREADTLALKSELKTDFDWK